MERTVRDNETTISIDGQSPVKVVEMSMTSEPIEYWSATAVTPNPSWRHTDPNGHKHRWVRDGKDWSIPTCATREEHVPCDGSCGNWDCDGYDITIYGCRECGAQVEPGWLPDNGKKYLPGPVSMSVKVEGAMRLSKFSARVPFVMYRGDAVEMRGAAYLTDQRTEANAKAIWAVSTFELQPDREYEPTT